jgi:hypothetical protein
MTTQGARPVSGPIGTGCASHSVEDGINGVRATLPNCWFDEAECSEGIRHLKSYRKTWDEIHGVWKDKPRHDQSSHCADALRYMCMAYREFPTETVGPPTTKQIIADMIKPKTMAQAWKEYAGELRDQDNAELPDEFEDFALSNNTTIRMK